MAPSEELADLLTELKRRSGRSYEWIGRRVNAGKSTVARYCTGHSVPAAFSTLEGIARACDATGAEISLLFRLWERASSTGAISDRADSGPRQPPGAAPIGEPAASAATETIGVSAGPEPPAHAENPVARHGGRWRRRWRWRWVTLAYLGLSVLLVVATAATHSRADHRPPPPVPADAAALGYVSVMPPDGPSIYWPTVLDMKEYSTQDGGLSQLWDMRTDGELRNQRWDITRVGVLLGFSYYELRNQLSGKCLDMATDVPMENGVRVQQWDCQGSPNQRWLAVPVQPGEDWVQLVNLKSATGPDRLCLDVTDRKYASGAPLQVWTCNGNWNQRWNMRT